MSKRQIVTLAFDSHFKDDRIYGDFLFANISRISRHDVMPDVRLRDDPCGPCKIGAVIKLSGEERQTVLTCTRLHIIIFM